MDYLLRLKQDAITMHEYCINIKTKRNISEMNTIEIAIFQKQKSKQASGKCHPCCNFVPQSRRLLTSDPDPDVFEIGLKIGERFEFPSISTRQSLISSPLAKKNPASETSSSSTVDSLRTRNSIPRSSSTMSTPNYQLVKDKKQMETSNFVLRCCGLPSLSNAGFYNHA